MWRFEGSLAVVILLTPAALASPPEPPAGFGFCSAPAPPLCADKDEAYDDAGGTKACEEAVARFRNSAFAYRACLEREIKRVVIEANATIDRFKCGLKAKRRCAYATGRARK
jgi:hypothetical protein